MKNKLKVLLPFIVCLAIQIVIAMVAGAVSSAMFASGSQDFSSMSQAEITEGVQTAYFAILPAVLLITHLVNVLVMLLWYKNMLKSDPDAKISENMDAKAVIFIVLMGLGIQFATSGVMNAINAFNPDLFNAYSELMEKSGLSSSNALSVFSAVVLAPIGEELCFRGLTMKLLKKAGAAFVLANIIQAVLFGVMHMNPVQSTYAAVMGLFMGYVVAKYDTVVAGILLHLVVNGSSSILTLLPESLETVPVIVVMTVIGVVLVVVSTLQVKKTAPEINFTLPPAMEEVEETAFAE